MNDREYYCSCVNDALAAFKTVGTSVSCERYGSGHINDTFLAKFDDSGKEVKYILQRINNTIFQDVEMLMRNVSLVTSFIREDAKKNNEDEKRSTLIIVKTTDDKDYFVDKISCYWRMYEFIEDAMCLDKASNKEDFYQSAVAFGHFQKQLADFDASQLGEVIPDFHNTPKRYNDFLKAVEEDKCGRAASVAEDIKEVSARIELINLAHNLLLEKKLPLRVTHNDTKLNNVMIDAISGKGLCVIDLDTVMPGLSIFDFGDSIRFGANTAAEDETDLSKVELDLELFKAYTEGFLKGCEGKLTENEIKYLPEGAMTMTLECGMRFLTDYLQGDTYFRVHHEGHNLERFRCQFKLLKSMEENHDKMVQIVNEVVNA